MIKIKYTLLALAILVSGLCSGQTLIEGQIIASEDLEGIHILNKSALKYAITQEDGSFTILARLVDTLVISGLKYQLKQVVVSKQMIDDRYLEVELEEKVTVLQEVIVGEILTGSLSSDVENSDAETDIDFYDLGIPGFTGTPLTQTERRLFDADAGKTFSINGGPFGGGAGVNLHKLLNLISGRTKKLKRNVRLEDNQECINYYKAEYGDDIFESNSLDEKHHNEFFQFCEDDFRITALCKENNSIKILEFIKAKLKIYKNNLKIGAED
ncbi:MAG: hypothetical protein HKN99_07780 [Winogradskyella sp.]|nr:hypothetical protein [Bacteroidia bacterium]NNC45766.1 hypothetical protein [Winogradskyella sp.]NNF86021.1 hypothetical protein [Winogradskyella sp.]NNK40472.1 hypothetical protein [Winogradskyella sp.]NNL82808.1 hypothetical protein [Winogradskyella sp.]